MRHFALGFLASVLLGGTATVVASAGDCSPSNVQANCCPAGCAAQRGQEWPLADAILRGCMRGLGCSRDDVAHATVFGECDCPDSDAPDAPDDDSFTCR